MFRRPRPSQPNPLNPAQMAVLMRANQLVAQGKPLQAAPLFVKTAEAMQASGHPRRAANLYARATHAYVDGNNASSALAYARQALLLFNQTQMTIRAATFYGNITRKMSERGMSAALADLNKEFGSVITALPTKPIALPPRRRVLLPTNCPTCGAPVHTEDATWVDEATVECEYCGALIRSQ